jgi:hypothetical protein
LIDEHVVLERVGQDPERPAGEVWLDVRGGEIAGIRVLYETFS